MNVFRHSVVLTVCILGLGCSSQPIITTQSIGSHVAWTEEEWIRIERGEKKPKRFVVWGDHQAVTTTIVNHLMASGHGVIERARLQDIFNEQKIILRHSTDDYADVVRVGRLLGANVVVFGESTVRSMPLSSMPREITMSDRLLAGSAAGGNPGAIQMLQLKQQAGDRMTVYQLNVAVRAVDVESGEVRWSGSSGFSQPITDLEPSLGALTNAAMGRAVCPIERGAKWTEFNSGKPNETWGCRK